MEKKFYLKNGKEVKVGDIIKCTDEVIHPILGKINSEITILLTEEIIPDLLKSGIISVSNTAPSDKMGHYIHIVLSKLGWTNPAGLKCIHDLQNTYPSVVFSMLLKEIAVELDKKYDDHIENSSEIFVVSTLDGRITKANKAHIRNYRNFAAFRSINDAKFACSILRDCLKEMYAKRK